MEQATEYEVLPPEITSNQKMLALPAQAQREVAIANEFVIDSPQMAEAAGDELARVAARRKAIETERFAITRPMDAAKQRVMAFFGQALDPLGTVEAIYRGKLSVWHAAERDRVCREQRAAQEAAERERAQREREAAEARQREAAAHEEARKLAEQAQATGNAETARQAEAAEQERQEAAQQADRASAEADAAAFAPPVVVHQTTKVSGVGFRESWKGEFTDLGELIVAAAARPELRYLLTGDTTALNQTARAQKGAVEIPGVRFYNETGTTVRGRGAARRA